MLENKNLEDIDPHSTSPFCRFELGLTQILRWKSLLLDFPLLDHLGHASDV